MSAKVKVSTSLLAEILFGYASFPVSIDDVRVIDPETLEFAISGPDVPDVPAVTAQFTVQQNRRGEKLHTLTFEPVKESDWEFYEISRDPVSGGVIYGARPKLSA